MTVEGADYRHQTSIVKVSPTRKKLGAKIRKIRKSIGLSQEELGYRAGVHRTYIGAIERAEQNVSIDNIHKIARALKVSPGELLK